MPVEADGSGREAQNGEETTSLASRISREMVRMMKQYYGKGPETAKSYLVDDLLFVVMRGGMIAAERTLIEGGQGEAVRQFRQRFEAEVGERLSGTVEQLTGRRVLSFHSQLLTDPDVTVQIFVFDSAAAPDTS